MALHSQRRVSVGRLLQSDAKTPASGFQVAVNDDDFRLAVGPQHVVEETIACLEGMPQDEDALGMSDGLRTAIPCRDITVGDDRLQLQRRHKRGNRNGQAVSFETEFFC